VINTNINRKATIKVAKALSKLNRKVVFVGGAVVSLYIESNLAEDVRPTKDLDLSFQITTVNQLEELRRDLVELGFKEARDEKVICRFTFDDLLIDVMSTQEIGWAPSNQWYDLGFQHAYAQELDDIEINLMPLPYFLAAKLDALFDRGINDLYASRDLEDIVYLLNYVSSINNKVLSGDKAVRHYIAETINEMLNNNKMMYAIEAHVYPPGDESVLSHIIEVMTELAENIKL
jgi:predicted nucleotidyltransferase